MYYKLLVLFQELPNNGVMLVYVSGDGCPGNAKAGEEGTWEQRSNHYFISVICLFNNALFISIGPYELGGVAMSHKKAGNEEAARRLRANLKDVHWCVSMRSFCTISKLFLTPCQQFYFSSLCSNQETTAQPACISRKQAKMSDYQLSIL